MTATSDNIPVPVPPPPEKQGTSSPGGESPWVIRYRTFCYRLVGRHLENAAGAEALGGRLRQAGVNVTPGMHRGMVLVTTIIAMVAALAVSVLLFHVLLQVSLWYAYVLLVTGVTCLSVVAGFRFLVGTRTTNRKDQLERELPFTLSELSVLASTGMSPIQLMRRMAARHHDVAMTSEFKTVIYRTDVEGKDLITALSETAKECPSTPVREALWDLANMIHQGGDLDEYLRSKSDDMLKLRRLVQHEFIERLTTFLDMYVTLVIVGVLMIAVGAFLINAFGSTAAGLDANTLLLLLTFGLVPVAVIMTIMLISIAYARAE